MVISATSTMLSTSWIPVVRIIAVPSALKASQAPARAAGVGKILMGLVLGLPIWPEAGAIEEAPPSENASDALLAPKVQYFRAPIGHLKGMFRVAKLKCK